ncbi:MAG TPA: hypothetical protein VGP93_19570, partial [Polyangiaceae bacterium]|nr:hypothetical protein [Polyangiaceae bacterium]
GGTDLLLEATATWRLDRLLFADEEVPLARVAIERDKLEAALVQKTLLRLFAWWRALRQSRDVTLPPDEREQAELATWEAQAELDVLTDGWFSQRLNELGLSSVLEEQDMGAAEDPKADSPAKPAGKEGDAPAQARPAAKSAAGNATQSGPALAELGRAAKVR